MTGLLLLLALLSAPLSGLGAQVSPGPRTPASLMELSGQISALSQRAAPAVVQVVVNGYGSSLDPESAHQVGLFGHEQSTGSGVIVDPDGYIITNAHVLKGAVKTRVLLLTGTQAGEDLSDMDGLDAKIVGVDEQTDLAVLKIQKGGLPFLKFMNSDQLRQGDLVLALGAPLGLRNSVSFGVVSAPSRAIGEENPMVYVQTDASINPGNSGGALVNMNGSLAGLNTFIVSQSGGNEGLGFAIPANTVRDVYRQLRKDGRVHRGEIGLYAQNITPVMAKGLSLERNRGVILADVEPDGPADRAGLKRGDVVLTLDGQSVLSAVQLQSRIYRRRAGDKLELQVLRGHEILKASPVVHDRSEKLSLLARLAHPEKNLIARLGILCVEIDKEVAAAFPDLRREYGLIVAAKSAEGQSQLLDLQPGDIIDAVNTSPVAFVDALRSAVDAMKPGDPVVLQIERDGRFQYVAFELDR